VFERGRRAFDEGKGGMGSNRVGTTEPKESRSTNGIAADPLSLLDRTSDSVDCELLDDVASDAHRRLLGEPEALGRGWQVTLERVDRALGRVDRALGRVDCHSDRRRWGRRKRRSVLSELLARMSETLAPVDQRLDNGLGRGRRHRRCLPQPTEQEEENKSVRLDLVLDAEKDAYLGSNTAQDRLGSASEGRR
jgi:hypothetical protein